MRKNTGKLWHLAWEDHQEDGRQVSHHCTPTSCGKEVSPSLGMIFTLSHKHLLKAVTVVFNKKADQELNYGFNFSKISKELFYSILD